MSVREKRCETCRWWDAHSLSLEKGDCRVPGDHRYSRVPIRNATGKIMSYALLDSFGPEETGPHFVCGCWDNGEAPTQQQERKG